MESHQTKQAVIYCRVSTKEQAEEGNSLVTQEKHCREFAKKNGYDIAAVFIEQGESAKTADRTELKKLMGFCAIKKNKVSAVIAYKLDRISRNTDDYSQIRILLKKYGVEIKSTSEYFEDTPAGRFMENIIANVAQFDNDVRAERCIGGMREAAKEGRYVWRAPMGYSNVKVDGKATITPNEMAPIILKVFEEVALNKYSVMEIRRKAKGLGLMGVKGKYIAQSYFYRLLKNEVYIGVIDKFGERNKGDFDPIVPEHIFWEVQEVLKEKTRKNRGNYCQHNHDFPLRKYIYHSNGRRLTGYWATGRQKRYAYYNFHTTKLIFPKEDMEKRFASWLNQFKLNLTKFESLHEKLNKVILKDKEAFFNQALLKKHIEDLKAKQGILLEKNLSGLISDELLKMKLTEVNLEIYRTIEQQNAESRLGEINVEELLRVTREVLINPGKIWLNSPVQTKVKLQWFYFPHGIEYAEKESRTTKICSLFKGISGISPLFSSKVNQRFLKSNTTNSRILNEPDAATLISEIQKLADIIQNKKDNEDEFP